LVALGSPYQSSTAPPCQEALDAFLAQTHWKRSSYYQINRTLRKYCTWTKALDKITHQDVSAVIYGISAKSEAAHALKDIKAFFNFCVPRYIKHSPCEGLKSPHKYVPRSRLLTEEEIKRIWKACDQLDSYGLQVKRLILSGQRCNQIFRLQEKWVDKKRQVIVFPREVMKGNKEHTLPYGPLMATLLDEFPVITNQGKRKRELDELAKVTGYTLHDCRKFFSSTHAKLHTPIDITEALLSHISGSRSDIQRIYDLYDRMDEMRTAVESFESYLKAAVAEV
jgi:integrase